MHGYAVAEIRQSMSDKGDGGARVEKSDFGIVGRVLVGWWGLGHVHCCVYGEAVFEIVHIVDGV